MLVALFINSRKGGTKIFKNLTKRDQLERLNLLEYNVTVTTPALSARKLKSEEEAQIGGHIVSSLSEVKVISFNRHPLKHADMSDSGLLAIETSTASGRHRALTQEVTVKYRTVNNDLEISFQDSLSTTHLRVIQFQIDKNRDLFIFTSINNTQHMLDLYFRFGNSPIPSELLYDKKMTVPFECEENQSNCTGKVYVPTQELHRCNTFAKICSLYIGMQLTGSPDVYGDVSLQLLNSGCQIGDLKEDVEHWSSESCQIITQETNVTYTTCECITNKRTFFAMTDIFVPPRPLNFKNLFTKGCIRCGDSVVIFSSLLLGITLVILCWTQRKDREDIQSIIIKDQRDGADPYLLVIDTSMCDPLGSKATNHVFLSFSLPIAESNHVKERFFALESIYRFYSLKLSEPNDAFSRGSRRFFLLSGNGTKLENAFKLHAWMNFNGKNVRWTPSKIAIYVPTSEHLCLDRMGDIANHFMLVNEFYFYDSLTIKGKPLFLISKSCEFYNKQYLNLKKIKVRVS